MKESQSSVETGSSAQLSETEATIWQILDLTMLVQHCNCYSFIPRKDMMGSKNRVPKWGPRAWPLNGNPICGPKTGSQRRVPKLDHIMGSHYLITKGRGCIGQGCSCHPLGCFDHSIIKTLSPATLVCTYLIFVIFFTQPQFEARIFYTWKCVNSQQQFTHNRTA